MGNQQLRCPDEFGQYGALNSFTGFNSMEEFLHFLDTVSLPTDVVKLEKIVTFVKEQSYPVWYNEGKLLDWYQKNTDKWLGDKPHMLLLAELMPTHERNWVDILLKKPPIAIMKIIAPKLKLDHVNENGETFLFKLDRYDLTYTCSVLEHIPNLPIQHRAHKYTSFVDEILLNEDFWTHHSIKIISHFLSLLWKHNYIFHDNTVKLTNKSLLTILVTLNEKKYKNSISRYSLLLRVETFDPALNPEWLIYLFHHYGSPDQYSFIYNLLARTDYKSFLRRAYLNEFNIFTIEFCDIVLECFFVEGNKARNMLEDADEKGNTIFHLVAQKHDKVILYPLLQIAQKHNINIKPNSEGKTPTQLYHESKL